MVKGTSLQSPQEFGSDGGESVAGDAGISITERSDSGDSIDVGAVDPAQLENTNGNSGPEKSGKRRGRPAGSGKRSSPQRNPTQASQTAPLDIGSLNTLIYNGHILLAKVAKIPELELDEEEAKKLSDATAAVAKHYNISVSQKTLDWSNFVTAISSVYGTRIFAIANRKRSEKVDLKTPEKTQPSAPSSPLPSNPYAAAGAAARASVNGNA